MLLKVISFTALILVTTLSYASRSDEKNVKMKLSESNSGYVLGKDEWISFLSCWKDLSEKLLDYSEGYFMRFSKEKGNSEHINFLDLKDVKLPRSLIDFYSAYIEMGGIYRSKNIGEGIGIFAPSDIQPLLTYNKELLNIKNEWPDESNDVEYFRYGVDQDSSAVRTSYQNNAIVIGQYGFSEYELIVLYPDSISKDGEMETALFANASETRTPSFAEMMRQLSIFFTKHPDSIPIYSQVQLKGTCADNLPLKNIWWK